MLKLNKGIHFNILTVFAIVFVCVYLYYTISDLKKVAVEVKKQSADIANIVTNLANVNKDLGELKKRAAACPVAGGCAIKPQINVAAQPVVQVAELSQAEAAQPQAPAEPEDDASSVDTNDVKNLLSDIPDDDAADEDAPADPPAARPVAWADMTIDQLKKECKAAGLSTKGTKEALAGRLSEHHAA